jgi:hypothetical protein
MFARLVNMLLEHAGGLCREMLYFPDRATRMRKMKVREVETVII